MCAWCWAGGMHYVSLPGIQRHATLKWSPQWTVRWRGRSYSAEITDRVRVLRSTTTQHSSASRHTGAAAKIHQSVLSASNHEDRGRDGKHCSWSLLLCTVTASCQQAGKSLCANDNKLTKEDRTWSDMKWIDHLPHKAVLPQSGISLELVRLRTNKLNSANKNYPALPNIIIMYALYIVLNT